MYDLIVIGAGVAGYTAAIRAAKAGLKTAIAESGDIGGTCLNRGCIPTKYMISEMHRYRDICESINEGVYSGGIKPDYERLASVLAQRTGRITAGVRWLLESCGVDIYTGYAKFSDSRHISINGETVLEADRFIIAAGSAPRELAAERAAQSGIFTTDDIWTRLHEVPESLAIIGGGAVGLEFAFIYAGLGSEVTVLEQRASFFGDIDADIDAEVVRMLRKYGIKYRLECSVDSIFEDDGTVVVTDASGKIITETSALLMAAGRIAQCGGLGLENAGVEFNSRGITTDDMHRTTAENIYAVGDIGGKSMLAYTAAAQAANAVEHILGNPPAKDESLVPVCIFTDPETAYVGMTERQALTAGIEVKAAKFLMSANGRSSVEGKGGFVKLITRTDTGAVIGGVCVCNAASEMINIVTAAIRQRLTAAQLAEQLFPHPTFSEAISDAAELIDGRCIYMM